MIYRKLVTSFFLCIFCNQQSAKANGNQQWKKCNYIVEMSRNIFNVVKIFYTNESN